MESGTPEKPALWAKPGLFRAEFAYSRDAVMRSIEGSLKRLDTDHIDMVAIHRVQCIRQGRIVSSLKTSRLHRQSKRSLSGALPCAAAQMVQAARRHVWRSNK